MKILIIKYGALGDVLRNTALLPKLKNKYPKSEIWWLTDTTAAPLLLHNPNIDQIIFEIGTSQIIGIKFNLVINMVEDIPLAKLQNVISYDKWMGVIFKNNKLKYTNDTSRYYDMSLLNTNQNGGHEEANRLKKENKESYETIWSQILKLDTTNIGIPELYLTTKEMKFGYSQLSKIGAEKFSEKVGIAFGAGNRWPSKQIPQKTVLLIADTIYKILGVPAILFGGNIEKNIKSNLVNRSDGTLINSGEHGLRDFSSIISHCDLIITSDSLALHIANAFDCKILAVFGPTSSTEISLRNGLKLVPPIDCKCWYKSKCKLINHCITEISRNEWKNTIRTLIY